MLQERYILPTLDDLLPKLAGASLFTPLDCVSRFWAISLANESTKLTTFITLFGRYCFRQLPFEISLVPEIFQRMMTDLLTDHEGVVLYMDDILVHGLTKPQHVE